MIIADTLIKKILTDNPMPKGKESFDNEASALEDVLPPGIFDDAPDLEIFRQPEPDSFESPPDTSKNLLGLYIWMNSPGTVVLFEENHAAYWRSLMKFAQQQFPFIDKDNAVRALHLVVNVTYQHELFHYTCDFSRRLFGSSFNRWHEEALAVASSWHWLQNQDRWNSFFGMMHPTLRRIVVKERFNYTSPGYRDWRQFADPSVFHAAVRDYLCPQAVQIFADCEQMNFGKWLIKHVADESNRAWDEDIW